MKKVLTATIAGLAIAGAVATATPANANVDSYIWDLETNSHAYFTGAKWKYIDLGQRICYDRSNGYSTRAIINMAYTNPNFDFDYTAAEEVVYLAIENMCL